MKQVRYAAAGAIGLAPLVIAAAAAPSAPQAPAGHAKKVSLEVNQPQPDATCYGGTEASASGARSYLRFWYTVAGSRTCIGTVEYFESVYPDTIGLDARIRIWDPGLHQTYYKPGTFTLQHQDYGISWTDVIRNYYGPGYHSVEVCAATVPDSKRSLILAGPVCRTVR
jgi:hypothetical protein